LLRWRLRLPLSQLLGRHGGLGADDHN